MKKLILFLSFLLINTEKNKIYCDIKGNIKNPGVYEIKENYTVQDVINDAGGLKKNSYTKNINLSKKVKDEMVIYIFSNKEITEVEKLNNCKCVPIIKYIDCEEKEVENNLTTTTSTTTRKDSTTKNVNTSNKISTTKKSMTNKTTTNKINDTTLKTTTRPSTTSKKITSNIITNNVTTTKKITEPITTTTIIIEERLININTASIEELITLKGLGEKKAKAIIEYRLNYGPFKKIEDIMNVSGIGKTTYENIKEYITV